MRGFEATFQGVHPILLHGMSRTQILKLGKFVKDDEKPAATPDEACRRALYIDDEGFIVLPTDNIRAAAVAAGQKIKVGSPPRQISTAEATDLWSFFDIEGEFIRILGPDGKPVQYPQIGEKVPWIEDVKRGVGRQAKVPTAVCVVRPKFPIWGFVMKGSYDERELPRAKFLELLKRMGRQGAGSFRASKGRGRYGISRPVRVDEVTLPDAVDDLTVTLDGKGVNLKAEPIQAEAAQKRGRKKKEAVEADGEKVVV